MERGKKKLLFLLCGVCFAGAAVCGWGLIREMIPGIEAERVYEKARMTGFPEGRGTRADAPDSRNQGEPLETMGEEPDWEALWAWNPDIVGWLRGPGTVIDYPVLLGKDDDYYLNHTPDRKQSIIGSVFLESRNQPDFMDDVSVLYGHRLRSGRMFSSLSGYKKQSYYEEHPYLYLYTPGPDYRVRLFAGTVMDGGEGSFPLRFADEKTRGEWLDGIIKASTFQGGGAPQDGERVLALCTCTYEYENARYVVYGGLEAIEKTEKHGNLR